MKTTAKILLVDDLEENLHAMRVTLASLDAEILTAQSGNAALALMVQHEFAVVLLDVQMPEMDGFETAELMRGNSGTKNVPIIFVTAISKENRHVFKGYASGAVDYLFKPIDPDILLCKVQVFINLYQVRIECQQMQQEAQRNKNIASLGLLAGGIAHDFNNILGAILGNINLAVINISPKDTETHMLLANAEKATLRAKGLTQQLLTFAKGGSPIKKVASVKDIIIDSANFVLHGSAVQVYFDFAPDLWTAKVDSDQIGQVIQNLIINAIQAMPDGGDITIRCTNFSADQQHATKMAPGSYLKITISDNGPGIPEELLETIFDPYITTKKEGNGLGLAICHSIINKHDGSITVTSQPELGTTFTIYLPSSNKDRALQEKKLSPRKYGQGQGQIILMDDDAMIREVAGQMLNKLGYSVLEAANGEDALQLYQDRYNNEEEIACIIVDLTVPGGMGGKETVNKLHALNPQAKVIVSSGYSKDSVMAEHQKYGFTACLMKPYQLEDLAQVLARIL